MAEFGYEVLALPDDKGFDLTAYLVPAGAVLLRRRRDCGFGLVSWRRAPDPTPGPAAGAFGRDSARLDQDLSRYDPVSDPSAPSIFLAFAAGFVSFVSPCVLPLVPGYLSTVCGLSPSQLRERKGVALRSVLVRAGLFILTFSLIFVLLGMTATGLGNALFDNRDDAREGGRHGDHRDGRLLRAGALPPDAQPRVASGCAYGARRSRRPADRRRRVRDRMDAVCRPGAGLDPRAGGDDTTPSPKAAALLAVYSAGLAVPFLLTAMAFNKATTAFGWIKRHYAVINGVAGVLLIAIGVLVLTGELTRLNAEAQSVMNDLDVNFFQEI